MLSPVLRKLESFGPITDEDKARLREIIEAEGKEIPAKTDVIVEGDNPHHVHLMASGFACRYKTLKNGKRQIVAYLIPGDFCDLHVFIMRSMDHSISTLASSRIVEIPKDQVSEILETSSLARPMLMSTLVDEATLREWVTNIGQRPAEARIAHLFCELHARFRLVGLTDDGAFELPVTQSDLADTVGLSLVHMNRSLQSLKERQLISFGSKKLVIHDVKRLEQLCGFKSNYLHLDEAEDDASDGD